MDRMASLCAGVSWTVPFGGGARGSGTGVPAAEQHKDGARESSWMKEGGDRGPSAARRSILSLASAAGSKARRRQTRTTGPWTRDGLCAA